MEFTPEQYTEGIRCCLVQRRRLHLSLDHASFADPEDIPAFEWRGERFYITNIELRYRDPGGIPCKGFVAITGVSRQGNDSGFYLPSAKPPTWTAGDYKRLFETVYNWNNTPLDPEPEAWLEDLFKDENALLREFLHDEQILPNGSFPVELRHDGPGVILTIINHTQRRHTPTDDERLVPDSYTYTQFTKDGKPQVAVISNYGWGDNYRDIIPGTIAEVAEKQPKRDLLPFLVSWLGKKDIHPTTVVFENLSWDNPNDYQ